MFLFFEFQEFERNAFGPFHNTSQASGTVPTESGEHLDGSRIEYFENNYIAALFASYKVRTFCAKCTER